MRARDRLAPPVAGAAAQEAGAVDTVLADDEDALSTFRPEHPLQNTRVGINAESISGDTEDDDAPDFSAHAEVLAADIEQLNRDRWTDAHRLPPARSMPEPT